MLLSDRPLTSSHATNRRAGQEGVINREEADFYARGLCKLLGRHPSLVAAWQSNKQDRLPGFYEYVAGVCEL